MQPVAERFSFPLSSFGIIVLPGAPRLKEHGKRLEASKVYFSPLVTEGHETLGSL